MMRFKRVSLPALTLFLSISFIISPQAESSDKVVLKKLEDSRFQLTLNDEPYIIKGVCYNPVPIGKGSDYDLFTDKKEPWRIDGKLMQDMNANAVFIYKPGDNLKRVNYVIENLFKVYGIRTVLGFKLGLWEFPPVDYADQEDRKRITGEVMRIVKSLKNNPGILIWVLGIENNFSFDSKEKAVIYYSFVNDIAKQIKRIDKSHPVALGNAETIYLAEAKSSTPDIDILASISYRGKSFGSLWREVEEKFGKPLVLIEFGCDSYDAFRNKEDQEIQAEFIKSQWLEILRNTANSSGKGNCLGGCIFEWTDEWWKSSEGRRESWLAHDTTGSWSGGGYYFDLPVSNHLNMNEEWWGIVSIDPQMEDGINKRTPKKAYYTLKELWGR